MKEKDEFAPLPLGLTEDQANAEFDRLQARLAPLWTSIRSMNQDPQTLSWSVDERGSASRAFASRRSKNGSCFPVAASGSRGPRSTSRRRRFTRTSSTTTSIYCRRVFRARRKRVLPVSPLDGFRRRHSARNSSRGPHAIRQIKSLIIDPERAHGPVRTTENERNVAIKLGFRWPAIRAHFISAPRAAAARSSVRRGSRIRSGSKISNRRTTWSTPSSRCAGPSPRSRRS